MMMVKTKWMECTEREVAADEQVKIMAPGIGTLAQESSHDLDLPEGLQDGEVVHIVGDELANVLVTLALEHQALIVLMVDLHSYAEASCERQVTELGRGRRLPR